ncbi:pilus assembly protein [Pseudarthrobacter phenanthrenivorans]|uniref:Pilus assembly protein n=1 Tax=Pseudarthrobacter phenanthrenivorans TaxID=361575 RepID=A0A3B0FG27_PSEPS|nr:TadE family protein [Pseudarthrobacter phenanthrenivorans]RKO25566.1 pilus assembly protein [Pseudarthrobacter phenanthrenivorans]
MPEASERGAAAVEFAIILPVLLTLVLGIMEFGRAYNTQLSLTHAAREGVRVMAISNDPVAAKAAAKNAAVSLTPSLTDSSISFSQPSCAPMKQMTVTINYSLSPLTGFFGPFPLTGKSVMLCGG